MPEHFEPQGVRFRDRNLGEMLLHQDDRQPSLKGWLLIRHPDGQWVTYRKATEADLDAIQFLQSNRYQPAPPVVAQWIEHEFRHRIMHDPAVMKTAAAVLKVGVDAGEPVLEALRTAITTAVLEIAGVNPDGPATN